MRTTTRPGIETCVPLRAKEAAICPSELAIIFASLSTAKIVV